MSVIEFIAATEWLYYFLVDNQLYLYGTFCVFLLLLIIIIKFTKPLPKEDKDKLERIIKIFVYPVMVILFLLMILFIPIRDPDLIGRSGYRFAQKGRVMMAPMLGVVWTLFIICVNLLFWKIRYWLKNKKRNG